MSSVCFIMTKNWRLYFLALKCISKLNTVNENGPVKSKWNKITITHLGPYKEYLDRAVSCCLNYSATEYSKLV